VGVGVILAMFIVRAGIIELELFRAIEENSRCVLQVELRYERELLHHLEQIYNVKVFFNLLLSFLVEGFLYFLGFLYSPFPTIKALHKADEVFGWKSSETPIVDVLHNLGILPLPPCLAIIPLLVSEELLNHARHNYLIDEEKYNELSKEQNRVIDATNIR
jgi:hypothetical protein